MTESLLMADGVLTTGGLLMSESPLMSESLLSAVAGQRRRSAAGARMSA
ncbi:hypothetical protein IFT77_13725 [Frigoribacterium sp. CFBP 13729]|nr:hypothetical protein [Frigoribacterium sp. CFBP 13729]